MFPSSPCRERHSPEWRVPQVRFFTWVLGSSFSFTTVSHPSSRSSHPVVSNSFTLALLHPFTLKLLHTRTFNFQLFTLNPQLCPHPFAVLFLPRNAPKNSPTASVLITSVFSSHPRRAILTPYRIKLRFPVLCESVEITTFTPRSLHILKYTSFKSRRSGYELHSIATPCFAQAASTFSMS